MDLAQEKGASSWLILCQLKSLALHCTKGPFVTHSLSDTIGIPYTLHQHVAVVPSFPWNMHSSSCPNSGFPTIRHNEIRDLTTNLLTEVCNDVCTEPELQPITGESLTGASSNVQDGARLDIAANGFWGGRFKRTCFDV